MDKELEQLRLLSLLHYVVAGVTVLLSLFPLLYLALGGLFIWRPDSLIGDTPPPPFWFGWLFFVLGGAGVLFEWALAVAMFYAGRCLRARKKYTYCFVVAVLDCLAIPVGTVLGVFTILVLAKPGVKELFTPSFAEERANQS